MLPRSLRGGCGPSGYSSVSQRCHRGECDWQDQHGWEGQFGLEASSDAMLAGVDGKRTLDVSARGQAIPGTQRDEVAVINGANVELNPGSGSADLRPAATGAGEDTVEG